MRGREDRSVCVRGIGRGEERERKGRRVGMENKGREIKRGMEGRKKKKKRRKDVAK